MASLGWSKVARYAVRFIACFLVMDLVLHFMYVVAIKDAKAWSGDTPGQISMIGFWNLVIMWLKARTGSLRTFPDAANVQLSSS